MMRGSKTLYIAGHTRLIGSAVVKQLSADERYQVVTATHNELELQDAAAVQRLCESQSPDFVILAAGDGCQGGIEWDVGRPDGAPRKLLDSARVHAKGWRARTDLWSGISDTYTSYRNNIEIAESLS
jgi:nucleoside-diphosphate-sugar epimerase